MAFPTTATMTFTAIPYASTAAQLALMMNPGVVPLDPSLPDSINVTVASDGAAVSGGNSVRTTVVALRQPPTHPTLANQPVDQGGNNVPYRVRVMSTSPLDANGSTGLETVTLNYLDPASGAHSEAINLNGTTWVNSVNVNYWNLVNLTNTTVGTLAGNQGVIIVQALPLVDPTGAPISTIPAPAVVASMPEVIFVNFPTTASLAEAFSCWLTAALEKLVGPVVTAAPVIA